MDTNGNEDEPGGPLKEREVCHRRVNKVPAALTDSLLPLNLPEGYSFADLELRRFDHDPIDLDLVQRICRINRLDFKKVLQSPRLQTTGIHVFDELN